MAKAVFRPNELIIVPDKVMISLPDSSQDNVRLSPQENDVEIVQAEEEYTGPTAEDLRREAEEFRLLWDEEKEAMIQAAKTEAEGIVRAAGLSAEKEKQQNTEEAAAITANARSEAEKIIAEAGRHAQETESEFRKTLEDEKKEALDKSREEGRAEGFAEGKDEVDRLIQRTQAVLERAQAKRGDILAETEQQIIDLVLLISRKVVKVIADNQREVVISNVLQALQKVKDRGNIMVRVNLTDLKLVTDHKKEFIKALEGIKSIQVMEDSSIDSGGCIIETDFGEIDARISSQLAELEAKILELSPIRSRIKSGSSSK